MFVIHLIGHFFHVVFAVLSFLAVYVLLSPYFILNIVYCCPRILRQAPGGGGGSQGTKLATLRLLDSLYYQTAEQLLLSSCEAPDHSTAVCV